MTHEERARERIDQIEDERRYWRELAGAFGWRLYGWSYKHSASFFTSKDRLLEITGIERDAMMRVLQQVERETEARNEAELRRLRKIEDAARKYRTLANEGAGYRTALDAAVALDAALETGNDAD